jgi:hypothetical protein
MPPRDQDRDDEIESRIDAAERNLDYWERRATVETLTDAQKRTMEGERASIETFKRVLRWRRLGAAGPFR